MTPNETILHAVQRFMAGHVDANEQDGYCLGFVTSILQAAFTLPIAEFYAKFVKLRADPVAHWESDGPWARDAEKSLRALGMAVHDPQPGDLLFIWRDAKSDEWSREAGHDVYIGHVGILIAPGLLIENVNPSYRPHSFSRGQIQLTPTAYWFAPSTVIRFDPSKGA